MALTVRRTASHSSTTVRHWWAARVSPIDRAVPAFGRLRAVWRKRELVSRCCEPSQRREREGEKEVVQSTERPVRKINKNKATASLVSPMDSVGASGRLCAVCSQDGLKTKGVIYISMGTHFHCTTLLHAKDMALPSCSTEPCQQSRCRSLSTSR